jgi:hypothetical protein
MCGAVLTAVTAPPCLEVTISQTVLLRDPIPSTQWVQAKASEGGWVRVGERGPVSDVVE